ncbi:lactoylglutathione lyase [Asticcacaulis solisilvae]
MLHTMLRVGDLDRSLEFYVRILGMRLLRRRDFPQGRFTLAFVGYGPEASSSVVELTHNWDRRGYAAGDAFGHIAIEVPDVFLAAAYLRDCGIPIVRRPGPLAGDPSDVIAFVEDPDGYRIELIQRKAREQGD